MNGTNRKKIGRWSDIATRQVVYESDLGIEVDEFDHFEIVRKRVFYDDVLMVTRHKEIGAGQMTVIAILFVFFVALAIAVKSLPALMLAFLILAMMLFVLGLLRLSLGVDVITIFGRRSKAAVRYVYRKERAQRVFDSICARAAAAQQRRADEIAASEPPPVVVEEEQPPAPPAEDFPTAAAPPPEQ